MKITVWGINYAPEQTGIAPYNTGLCEHLAAAGHEVRMLTTFSYYPEWRKAPGDRGKLFRTELTNGVKVHRCWHYVPPRPTALKRMAHEATFVITSWVRFLCTPSPDVVIVISPPLLLGLAAWIGCVFKRSRYVFHVQDMQPDAAVMLGLLRPGLLTRILYFLEGQAYRHAALVSGITGGMLRMFSDKNVPEDKQVLFPNWTPATEVVAPEPGQFRQRLKIEPATFLTVYSGNLGKKQGLDILLELAARYQKRQKTDPCDRELRIIIAGDGVEKPAIEARIRDEGLKNVTLLPLLPREEYGQLLVDANVCLVTQQPGSGALFFPSKLLTILAYGRPVVGVADQDGELERAINVGRFGWSAKPGDPAGLESAIEAAMKDEGERVRRGQNGRQWARQFAPKSVLERFEGTLRTRFDRPDEDLRDGPAKSD